MGVAHRYAELESQLRNLKQDLKFLALGRVVAEVIAVGGGEPRLSIGDHHLPEEHALRLAAWIQHTFRREGVDRS